MYGLLGPSSIECATGWHCLTRESYTALLTEAIYLQLCVSNLFFKTGE